MPAQSLKIGLIGAGRIGRMHAANLTTHIPSVELIMVADVLEENARQCAKRYAIPFPTQDYHAILDRPDIEAVVICSSTDTHASIIKEAAQAGKHIFCEKPIALNLPSIDRALDAVARAGVKLQLGFNRRFDASYSRVRQAVEQGETGRLQQLHIISRDPAPPLIEYIPGSGGLFLDMTIHDFDMARFLAGSEVDEVFVMAGVMVDPAIGEVGDVDTATILLRFSNGVIGTIENCRRAAYGYDQRVEVLGSAGAVRTENKYSNTAIISDSSSIRRDLPLHFYIERYTQSYVTEIEAFVDAVLHDKPVPVTGYDGRMALVLGLAAKKSLAEHRPVHLSEIGRESN
ncbi:MAG: inositol 2-dehydrogenase [Chloroflexi bacterium]|nr:MAG: inositol 2-dehydrogenase [Chloroflexota bacterium]